ncbi:MBL fold metallo-hydrolase [Kribbella antibiotica]|uniref:MBL fold metallo-hydrolase n=1 Tax=Kribbella antibiotica TaxID=190195 RepID=A0A4V6PEA0_9ACTN|nr:MBL fold metallo-hydrolase [Kribbella antibiotica]TDD62007.1 MBL fold metallo-hydrolase [Kribbella antibiotica]
MPKASGDPLKAGLPDSGEIEVSIFGPGKGESILVHLGANEWMVVDSCLNQSDKSHPTLEYLQGLGVDIATQVVLVVGTHAHDDHIAGLAAVFAAAKGAKFAASAAATTEEFFAQMEVDLTIEPHLRSSIRAEYAEILAEVDRRVDAGLYAMARRELWIRNSGSSGPSGRVVALSPSDTAFKRAQKRLAAGTANLDDRVKLSKGDPNEMAVALWVEVGNQVALLGADLLKGPAGCGWGAVLSDLKSPFWTPTAKASLFKVPHHGAPNAHHDGVWNDILEPEVVGVMAPYRAGVTPRPAPDDIQRILALTPHAFITATPTRPEPKAVRKTAASLRELTASVREPWGVPGHVRARRRDGAADWTVETFWPARHLSQV